MNLSYFEIEYCDLLLEKHAKEWPANIRAAYTCLIDIIPFLPDFCSDLIALGQFPLAECEPDSYVQEYQEWLPTFRQQMEQVPEVLWTWHRAISADEQRYHSRKAAAIHLCCIQCQELMGLNCEFLKVYLSGMDRAALLVCRTDDDFMETSTTLIVPTDGNVWEVI